MTSLDYSIMKGIWKMDIGKGVERSMMFRGMLYLKDFMTKGRG